MPSVVAPKSRWMVGIATFTMLMSSTDMNMPTISTSNGTSQPLFGALAAGGAAGARSTVSALIGPDRPRQLATSSNERMLILKVTGLPVRRLRLYGLPGALAHNVGERREKLLDVVLSGGHLVSCCHDG